jgi:uncharacterized protein (TIGR02001 family)
MSHRRIVAVVACLLGAAALSPSAHAAVSGTLTLTSDYVFRGFTQTAEEPALQGGLEFESESGFYAGGWGSSISWLSDLGDDISSQLEVDAYAGYRGQFNDTVSYDVGAIYYWYPGSYPSGFNDADTTELYFGISAGVFSAKYSYAVTDLFGIDDSDGSSYLEAGLDFGFAETWSLGLHAGKQFISGDFGEDYVDYKVAVSKEFANDFGVDLGWYDTDVDGADSNVFIAVTKSF